MDRMSTEYESEFDSEMYKLRDNSDASFLIKKHGPKKGKRPIAIVEIKPRDDSKIPLGTYSSDHPPKGFVVELSPDGAEHSVTSQVVSFGTEKSDRYELTFLIANYGDRTVIADIWEL